MEERHNSIANALELHLSCINPSICSLQHWIACLNNHIGFTCTGRQCYLSLTIVAWHQGHLPFHSRSSSDIVPRSSAVLSKVICHIGRWPWIIEQMTLPAMLDPKDRHSILWIPFWQHFSQSYKIKFTGNSLAPNLPNGSSNFVKVGKVPVLVAQITQWEKTSHTSHLLLMAMNLPCLI